MAGIVRVAVLPAALAALIALAPAAEAGAPAGGSPKAPATQTDDELKKQREEVERLKREAAAKRKAATELKGRETSALKGLRQTEGRLAATQKKIQRLNAQEKRVQGEIGTTTRELEQTRATLGEQRALLARRAREIYMHGRARPFEIVFSSRTFADLVRRSSYLSLVLESDRRLVDSIASRESAIEEKKDLLERKHDELRGVRRDREKEKQALARLRSERRTQVSKIKNDRESLEAAAKELERSAKRVQSLIQELEARRLRELKGGEETPLDRTNFAANRGRLPWPVEGRIVTGFGSNRHPKFGTTVFSNGIDIEAPAGAPIRAVATGRVDFVDWLPGYGQCVILSHGKGYYSLYAHCSEVLLAVGAAVEPGQIIARVGDTGSLIGDALHFEIRNGRTAVDPEAWLR
jgi:septal ring factor EnvC (AmiA/AmiB activator)